jgi:hypothetical protein
VSAETSHNAEEIAHQREAETLRAQVLGTTVGQRIYNVGGRPRVVVDWLARCCMGWHRRKHDRVPIVLHEVSFVTFIACGLRFIAA